MRSTATIGRVRPLVAPAVAAVSWPLVYLSATLIVWAISPFLRRLMDWKTGLFSAISPFSALPLLILVPAIFMLLTHRARPINKSYETIALLWLFGFGYGLLIAFLAGHLLGGLYSFLTFSLPLGFGLWVATRAEEADVLCRRISQTGIVLACILSIYGIIQYIVVPPWDAVWMKGVDLNTFGFPLPFKVRVFSMLNSPATLGEFLTVATIMFLPRLTLKSGFVLLPIFIGMGLTSLRAGWVTLALSILVFAYFTTRRRQVLKGVAVFIGSGVFAIAVLQPLLPIGIGAVLENRLLTLTDIAHDESAGSRAAQISDAFDLGIHDPEGSGLGSIGVATRLNSADESASNLDSGYLTRFVEMGLPGTIAFIASIGVALSVAIRKWKTAVRNHDREMQNLAALAITMQIALLSLNIFADSSTGLQAIFAWASLGLIIRSPLPKRMLQ